MTEQQKNALRWVLIEAIDLHYARDLSPKDTANEASDLQSLIELLRDNGGKIDNKLRLEPERDSMGARLDGLGEIE